eukprot:TRINITY_DN1315_c0_g1_i3.p1 TRINITY_DN1315_c0_g1~~TRINITY_DN1315_c0_g1_i3.p1  ORF type:complete len:308 (-),score=50.75 TRINITY_DN1315_c0_g1_i3:293-1216(-)
MLYGGPVVLVYGWILVCVMSLMVALAMAEICSSYPTSGGLYFWSASLAGEKWAPLASWITGWFNAIGVWAVTASVNFSLAQWICTTILLSTGTGTGGGYYPSKSALIGIYAAILVVNGIINSLLVGVLAWLEFVFDVWHIAGTFFLTILLPSVAKVRQDAKYVFTTFTPDPSAGAPSDAYLFLLGLLFAQYSISGFDASAHMSEETKSADSSGSWGMVMAVSVSSLVGLFYILGLTFSIADPSTITDPNNEAGGYASAEIIWQAFNGRYGSGTGGIVCMQIVSVAIFFCGVSCLTSCSRMRLWLWRW